MTQGKIYDVINQVEDCFIVVDDTGKNWQGLCHRFEVVEEQKEKINSIKFKDDDFVSLKQEKMMRDAWRVLFCLLIAGHLASTAATQTATDTFNYPQKVHKKNRNKPHHETRTSHPTVVVIYPDNARRTPTPSCSPDRRPANTRRRRPSAAY